MSPNRRILLNIVATYGRSLYALVLGLFSGRWALMALGEVDYGLLGLVGGLTIFVYFLNGILSSAIGRFYAIAIGKQKLNFEKGMAESRKWFTTAVIVQTVMPTILLVSCYPIGEWAVKYFLTIPADRVFACVWVWRFVCISCYLQMISLPWNAMYMAHQYIAELTIYSFATSTLNCVFLYYMVTHPGVWLSRYAFWQCLLSILPSVIIWIRAIWLFPECRFEKRYIKCWRNILEMANFAVWTSWGTLGAILRGQGIAILVNKYFGPKANAGVAVGTNLSTQCNSLSGSLLGAFSPAIYNAWGAKQFDYARLLGYRACKFATMLTLVFSLPLAIEVDEVLHLWLKNPPQYAAEICLFIMVMTIIDKMAVGHMICVNANGKIAKYQAFLGTSLVMTLPLAWIFIELGFGIYSIGWAMIGTMTLCAAGRVWFARRLVGMSARHWMKKILAPISVLIGVALVVGTMPKCFMVPSIWRVCLTTALSELLIITVGWFLVLDLSERSFILAKLHGLWAKVCSQ